MKLARSRTYNSHRGRRALDRARNPEKVSYHAIQRFIEDAALDHSIDIGNDTVSAERHIRTLCARATKIRRGRTTMIVSSPPWFIFYRDRTVVTVMHKDAQRRWVNS